MKIYLVSSGGYSDYVIHKVFLDKGKAETYSKLIDGYVEEFETSDDSFQTELSSLKEYTLVDFFFERKKTEKKSFNIMDLSTWLDSNEDMYKEQIKYEEEERFSIGFRHYNSFSESAYESSPIRPEDSDNQFKILKSGEYYRLVITRIFEGNIIIDKNILEEKYKKIMHDIFAECMSLLHQERWTLNMINDWLKEKYPVHQTFRI